LSEKISFIHPWLSLVVNLVPFNTQSVLDVGICYGNTGFLLRRSRHSLSRLDGIEIWPPYAEDSFNVKIYDRIMVGSCVPILQKIPDKSYGVVIATELIEHLDHSDGLIFLGQVERIASECIIITTPSHFFESYSFDDNSFQLHKSLWKIKDFKSRGYSVRGWGFRKDLISFQSLVYRFPQLAEILIAKKMI